MKRFITILIFFCIWSCSETKPKSKEIFTEEELGIIQANQDVIKDFGKSHQSMKMDDLKMLVVLAAKGVKLDTTKYKSVHFHLKGWHIDYSNDHEIYDSLLDVHYGIKIKEVDQTEYLKMFGAEKIDSFSDARRKSGGYIMQFQTLMYDIERKNNYSNDSYEKAYWEEREISFNRFKNEVKTKSYRKEFQNQEWKESAYYACELKNLDDIKFVDLFDGCGEQILRYCVYEVPNKGLVGIADTIKSVIKEKLLGHVDTTALLPLKFDFDSLGNLKFVKSKKKALDEKLFEIFEKISGTQRVKFLNKKLVGYSFTVNRGDLNYWLTGSRK